METLQDSIRRANTATQRPPPKSSRNAPPLASQFMATSVVSFKPDDSVAKVVHTLVQKRFSGAPVVDYEGKVVGVISELDCMKLLADDKFHQEGAAIGTKVSNLMSPVVITITPDTDLFSIAQCFVSSGVRRLPVLDGEHLVGLVSRRDVLRAMREFVR